jgi:RNA polymerase sigma-70 factor, ECF subfamily
MSSDGYVIRHTADPHAPGSASTEAGADVVSMDEHAFQAFYRAHGRALWSYLCRILGNPAQADDALQEAFCKFLVAPIGGLGESEQRAYLFRIATNLVIDQWRKRSREQQALEQWPTADRAEKNQPSAASIDMSRTFAELKPRERALLWLAYVEGSAHDEIAQSLGLKPKSIRVLLFRARRRLAALLEKKGLRA